MISRSRIFLAAAVVLVLASACSSAPTRSLYFVWRGSGCIPPTKAHPDKAAGFTSWGAANSVAYSEEFGTLQYWTKYMALTGLELRAARRHHKSRATIRKLQNDLGIGEYQLKGNSPPCRRIVKKG